MGTRNTLAKYIAGSVAQRSMVKRALPKEPDVSFFIASMRKIYELEFAHKIKREKNRSLIVWRHCIPFLVSVHMKLCKQN